MYKKNLFFFVILYSFIFNTITFANIIVYLDMNKIMNTSKPGISILEQLKLINNNNLIFFKKSEKDFKQQETTLRTQKNILSKDEFTKKFNNLKIEISKYNEIKNDKINELNRLKLNATNKFLKLINPLLTEYSAQNSISMIIQKKNLVIGINELDITEKILTIINNKITKIDIK